MKYTYVGTYSHWFQNEYLLKSVEYAQDSYLWPSPPQQRWCRFLILSTYVYRCSSIETEARDYDTYSILYFMICSRESTEMMSSQHELRNKREIVRLGFEFVGFQTKHPLLFRKYCYITAPTVPIEHGGENKSRRWWQRITVRALWSTRIINRKNHSTINYASEEPQEDKDFAIKWLFFRYECWILNKVRNNKICQRINAKS